MTETNGNQDDPQEPIENNAKACIDRGIVYINKGDYDLAITNFGKAIELAPDNAQVYIWRGLTHYSKGDYDHAITDLDKAIQIEPNDAPAYIGRGLVYYRKSDYDRAITDFTKVIKLKPNDTHTYMNRGFAYHYKSDYNRAITDFSKAIKLEPNNADLYSSRGLAYHSMDDCDRAITDFDKIIELAPNNAEAYRNRGATYSAKGEYDHAITDFKKAIELNPNNAKAYVWRGHTYRRKNDHNRSFADFGEAIRISPNLKSEIPYAYIRFQLQAITNASLRIKSFQYCMDLLEIITELKKNLLKRDIVAHYTSLDVLQKLLSGERFRFYNATYMNDPQEGETFFEILRKEDDIDIKERFYENSTDFHSSAYIGSFTKVDDPQEEDKLSLWQTYGKHKNQDASGSCMVFKEASCFSEDIPLHFGSMKMQKAFLNQKTSMHFGSMKTQETFLSQKASDKLCLYKVVYQKNINDKLIAIIKNLAIQLGVINRECLEGASNNEEKDLIRGLVRELLDEIRFLFKGDHYIGENEMRVVLIRHISVDSDLSNSGIKEDIGYCPPRFYLDAPEGFHFDKVLLGPKAPGLVEWQKWARLKPHGRGILIEKSKIPYKG